MYVYLNVQRTHRKGDGFGWVCAGNRGGYDWPTDVCKTEDLFRDVLLRERGKFMRFIAPSVYIPVWSKKI